MSLLLTSRQSIGGGVAGRVRVRSIGGSAAVHPHQSVLCASGIPEKVHQLGPLHNIDAARLLEKRSPRKVLSTVQMPAQSGGVLDANRRAGVEA